jgi:hypothetical protein
MLSIRIFLGYCADNSPQVLAHCFEYSGAWTDVAHAVLTRGRAFQPWC